MKRILKSFIIGLFILSINSFVEAQDINRSAPVAVQCGDIVESEFLHDYEEQNFAIDLKAGDSLQVSIIPLAASLKTIIMVTGPTNRGIAVSNGRVGSDSFDFYGFDSQPSLDTSMLGSTGSYTIRVLNTRFANNFGYNFNADKYPMFPISGGIGVYTLYVSCILRDGTVIKAGDSSFGQSDPTPLPAGNSIVIPDLTSATKIPMIAGIPMSSGVTPTGGEITAYNLDANEGDNLALSFTRLSGNLNLGLAVMSPDNKVVFQASLVTSSELTTKLTLPSAGTYTIGVYRIDLMPPDAPEATAFQVQAALNP